MVVEASPSAAFVMSPPEFLLEFLIVALDAPAQLGQIDQAFECDVRGQRGEPVFGWFLLALGPFDQEPFFGMRPAAMGGAHAPTCKSRGQPLRRAVAPADRAPR